MRRKTILFAALSVFMISILGAPVAAFAAQSAIVVAEGYSCMGVDKSKRETETEAKAEAKRNAVENAKTYIKSETQVKDFQLEKDLIAAYARATVTVLEELKDGAGWYKDNASGDCFKARIKAEVVPDERAMNQLARKAGFSDDPAAPLNVQVWTDKPEYLQGEQIRIYLKGNRPFYARLLYRDTSGNTLQILPNPYRQDNYFRGGVVYELPEGDKDRFQLEVSPPFGREQIVLHAGTSPLGDLDLEKAGDVYDVKTKRPDIGVKSRGIKLVGGSQPGGHPAPATQGAGFVESQVEIGTKR
jgi:hypothetical protein